MRTKEKEKRERREEGSGRRTDEIISENYHHWLKNIEGLVYENLWKHPKEKI